MAGQSKGRKIGNKKKVPAQKRYTAERRWERNKRLNKERAAKQDKQNESKVLRVARGTARNVRRLAKQKAWTIINAAVDKDIA